MPKIRAIECSKKKKLNKNFHIENIHVFLHDWNLLQNQYLY